MHGCSRGGVHGFIWGGMHGFIWGGMHGFIWGGMCGFIQGGMHGFIQGGMHGFIRGGGMCGFFSFFGYNEIRSMSGRYASYWNAFLFKTIGLKERKKTWMYRSERYHIADELLENKHLRSFKHAWFTSLKKSWPPEIIVHFLWVSFCL